MVRPTKVSKKAESSLGEDDVAIALFTDGFTNRNTRGNDFTIVHAIILNYDPSLRYMTDLIFV